MAESDSIMNTTLLTLLTLFHVSLFNYETSKHALVVKHLRDMK